MPYSVEDLILAHDRRGISQLREHMAPDFCGQAAAYLMDCLGPGSGTVIVATGFYILSAGAPETDGPLGAVVIGDALNALGHKVVHVTDEYTAPLMSALRGDSCRVIEFPITAEHESQAFAKQVLDEVAPSALISIERCGLTADGHYRNMHGHDISAYNARLDHLFINQDRTVAIGDGGNEIGMGNLAEQVTEVPTLVKDPCVTKVNRLIISSVSNWGGYGLVASMSRLCGRNLLPSIEEEQDLLRKAVAAGCVDGMSGIVEHKVDGFTMDENSNALRALHDHLTGEGIGD